MEVHHQRCEACGVINVHNIQVWEPGVPQTVFVRCAACGALVARYRLSEYYHHGKDISSWLRSLGSTTAESGRDFLGEFERVRQDAVQEFEAAVRQIETAGDGTNSSAISDNTASESRE